MDKQPIDEEIVPEQIEELEELEELEAMQDECDTTQPVVNWKCIWFTVALVYGYWYLPPKNKWVLVSLLYFPYLVMAHYDHYYECQRNLGPTYLAMFYKWAKPQESKQIVQYENWCPEIKNKVLMVDVIILLSVLSLVPAFMRWNPKP
jgi:hypothetical protein